MSAAATDIAGRALARRSSTIGRAEWAARYASIDGRRFSFQRHEYLRGIYECEHHNIVLEKAAQMGGSVFGIIDALWAIDTGRVGRVIYFFPTAADVEDFSHDRVRPMILDCPRLASRVKGIDNAGYKQFLDPADGALAAAIYFRGMKSKVSTSSVPADQIMIDERDKVSVRDYELALKRISHSEKGYRREACTPTVSDYGIDAVFLRSDMRWWTMKCAACGEWNHPEKTFRDDGGPERVLYEKDSEVFLGCRKCGARLDPAAGEWVADHPSRSDIAGFHISQLYSQVVQSGRPIQKVILDDWRDTRYIQDFWNSRIGLPYEDNTSSMTLDMLNACGGDYEMKRRGAACTMGVDQGNVLHAVVSSYSNSCRQVIFAGVLERFEQLDTLMKDYDVRTCVIDGLPNTHSAREFAARFPGRVYLCFYNANVRGETRWSESDSTVSVNRTEALDAALERYARGGVRLPRASLIEDVFKKQMCNSVRKPVRGDGGEIKGFEWVRRGADHFRHADSYDCIAGSRRGRDLGEILLGVASEEPRNGFDTPGARVAGSNDRPAAEASSEPSDMDDW